MASYNPMEDPCFLELVEAESDFNASLMFVTFRLLFPEREPKEICDAVLEAYRLLTDNSDT